MQIIFLFKLFYSSACIFTQGLYNEGVIYLYRIGFSQIVFITYINLLLKMHIFFSKIHTVL